MAVAPAPHPNAVYRVLKEAARRYLSGGSAATIAINTISGFVHTAAFAVAGTVTPAAGVPMPASVNVQIMQGATQKAAQTAPVNGVTGAYTTTFAANTLTAGSYTAVVSSTTPAATATSNTFTVT